MKKRILFTIPNFDTAGSGKAMLNIAQGLNPELFEPHIACFHDRGEFFKVVKKSGIPVHLLEYVSPARPLSLLIKKAWNVSRIFKRINPDLIHSFHYSADYTEAIAAKMAGIPWVFTKKNMSWEGASRNAWKLRSWMANGIVIQNTDMVKKFYPKSKKTFLIPRGVDTFHYKPEKPEPGIRKQMQTPADKRIVICVANMLPRKGIELLIDAFRKLSPLSDGWMLWLVGDNQNSYGKYLMELVKEWNLEQAIRFSGKVENVKAYLNHAEIFVLPTKNEGTPVALLEAMANGKAVLGSEVPGVKDQLKAFPWHLFRTGSIDSLYKKLATLMQNTPEENKAIGANFMDLANNQFAIEHEIKKHEQFYLQVLKKEIHSCNSLLKV